MITETLVTEMLSNGYIWAFDVFVVHRMGIVRQTTFMSFQYFMSPFTISTLNGEAHAKRKIIDCVLERCK
jgi:hypothetical protein